MTTYMKIFEERISGLSKGVGEYPSRRAARSSKYNF